MDSFFLGSAMSHQTNPSLTPSIDLLLETEERLSAPITRPVRITPVEQAPDLMPSRVSSSWYSESALVELKKRHDIQPAYCGIDLEDVETRRLKALCFEPLQPIPSSIFRLDDSPRLGEEPRPEKPESQTGGMVIAFVVSATVILVLLAVVSLTASAQTTVPPTPPSPTTAAQGWGMMWAKVLDVSGPASQILNGLFLLAFWYRERERNKADKEKMALHEAQVERIKESEGEKLALLERLTRSNEENLKLRAETHRLEAEKNAEECAKLRAKFELSEGKNEKISKENRELQAIAKGLRDRCEDASRNASAWRRRAEQLEGKY